ncbi:hypothetical protein ACFX2C_026865 [Malus domestica]
MPPSFTSWLGNFQSVFEQVATQEVISLEANLISQLASYREDASFKADTNPKSDTLTLEKVKDANTIICKLIQRANFLLKSPAEDEKTVPLFSGSLLQFVVKETKALQIQVVLGFGGSSVSRIAYRSVWYDGDGLCWNVPIMGHLFLPLQSKCPSYLSIKRQ